MNRKEQTIQQLEELEKQIYNIKNSTAESIWERNKEKVLDQALVETLDELDSNELNTLIDLAISLIDDYGLFENLKNKNKEIFIKIEEDFQIPGTDIILEKNDKIKIINEASEDNIKNIGHFMNKQTHFSQASINKIIKEESSAIDAMLAAFYEAESRMIDTLLKKSDLDEISKDMKKVKKGFNVLWELIKSNHNIR